MFCGEGRLRPPFSWESDARTSDWREWDWPPRRRPRIEVLPPEQHEWKGTNYTKRLYIGIERRRRTNLLPLIIIGLVLFALWRLKFGPLVMLLALTGMLPHS